ncbi:hypothetical protein P7K49_032386 [Saguinus oedipus]|uniref:Uncharacterized protein n=1 Tax=Saguinus oedipus TaxID=9490 RepID=A0ABQ9TY29_SAGOE|nr:hypothetical protein P7K49_032386 [Saguinus oedipus]
MGWVVVVGAGLQAFPLLQLCALVFGVNTFFATIVKTVITFIVSDVRGLGLPVRQQVSRFQACPRGRKLLVGTMPGPPGDTLAKAPAGLHCLSWAGASVGPGPRWERQSLCSPWRTVADLVPALCLWLLEQAT